jgi:Fur family ferric uptake transcriptional regulator
MAAKTTLIEQECIKHGLRMTGQRRIIAKVISAAHDHPDVEELHRRAVKLDKHIALSTVYRTVKLLEDAGILSRHDFGDGRARYEHAPAEHHDHLINTQTNEVIEFHSEEIEELQREIARKLGFRLIAHRMELYGVPLKDEER